jgi:hypothetical protein
MGGDVAVESKVGEGTRFTVVLPVKPPLNELSAPDSCEFYGDAEARDSGRGGKNEFLAFADSDDIGVEDKQ